MMRGVALALACALGTAPAIAQPVLADQGCAGEGRGLRSINADRSTVVNFRNVSNRPVRAYWLNYEGFRVYYAEIAPGRSMSQQTFVTHPWVITADSSGRCVALFMPPAAPATAVIKP